MSLARLFIGSSTEGLPVAQNLQADLEASSIYEVTRWDQNIFEPSGYALESLAKVAKTSDFAVLIATPDDISISREETAPSIRDNVILEFGIFVGAIGRERTYLLSTGDRSLKMPTDVLGLTRLAYQPREDGNLRAAVNGATLQIEKMVKSQGRRAYDGPIVQGSARHESALKYEISLLTTNAVSQGWEVKTNSVTTLRLRSPRGKTVTLSKSGAEATRADLRRFAASLRAAGLRVNSSLRRSIDSSPF